MIKTSVESFLRFSIYLLKKASNTSAQSSERVTVLLVGAVIPALSIARHPD